MKIGACAGRSSWTGGVVATVPRIIRLALGVGAIACLFAKSSGAYMTVVISTATTESTEQALLNQIAQQFSASVYINPLAANVYQVKLFGLNPNYVPPAPSTPIVTLDMITTRLASLTTDQYVQGFANGESYQQNVDMGILSGFMVNCSTASCFGASSATWNAPTCTAALGTVDQSIYDLRFSTPTSIPPVGGY